jgi:NADH-quinone oxidoreductase subunit H
MPVAWVLLKVVAIVAPLMISVAYLTYAERKVIAAMQLRKGPNVVGPFGLLQPLMDGVKLLLKETVIPSGANKKLFLAAPMITFILAMVGWAVIPFDANLILADVNVGVLYLFAISSLGVYGIIIAGWASNSQYSFLGAIRSSAQMVSYEVSLGLIVITVLLFAGSLNLSDIVYSYQDRTGLEHLLLVPMAVMFFISTLAETNRHPFDLPEAEAELVSGFNVEYSSMPFALFFLGEYANMILMCAMTSVLFLGGWLPPLDIDILYTIPGPIWLAFKIAFLLFCFLWVRASLPRYRYDQLMRLGWKVFLPLSLLWVVVVSGYLVYTGKINRDAQTESEIPAQEEVISNDKAEVGDV